MSSVSCLLQEVELLEGMNLRPLCSSWDSTSLRGWVLRLTMAVLSGPKVNLWVFLGGAGENPAIQHSHLLLGWVN